MSVSTVTRPRSLAPHHSRETWLDLWRGFAVLLMLETHGVNLFATAMSGSSERLGWLNFINGLAAPTFLWIAGYLQGKSIAKVLAKGRSAFSKNRLQRLTILFIVGLCLQIPWQAWINHQWNLEAWTLLFQVNILPCMAVSLMLLLIIAQVSKKHFRRVTSAIAIAVILLAPVAKSWQTGFLPIDTWINHQTGSLFPLFPWFSFCALGLVMSGWQRSLSWWLPIAITLLLAGHHLQSGDFQAEHPGFFAERLGWVLLTGILIKALSQHKAAKLLGSVSLAGRESLLIYVFHLVILYALPIAGGRTLEQVWSDRLTLLQTTMALAALLLICLLAAWLNEQRKRHQSERQSSAKEPIPAS